MPADPFEAAKVRELATFIDLHLELVARELYPQAFFGGTVDDATKARVRKLLERAHRRASSGWRSSRPTWPAIASRWPTASAFVSLPLVAMASKLVLGEDLLAAAGVDWKAYVKLIGERPSAQSVVADRKAAEAAMAAAAAAKKGT